MKLGRPSWESEGRYELSDAYLNGRLRVLRDIVGLLGLGRMVSGGVRSGCGPGTKRLDD